MFFLTEKKKLPVKYSLGSGKLTHTEKGLTYFRFRYKGNFVNKFLKSKSRKAKEL